VGKLVELNLIIDAVTYRDPPALDRPAAARSARDVIEHPLSRR